MNDAIIAVDACVQIPDAHLKGRSSKGKAACGVVIIDEYGVESNLGKFLGEMTVPEAEFNGLIFGLDQATGILRRNRKIEVRMDSELVIKWMSGEYRMKKEHIRPLFDEANKLTGRFKQVDFNHHPRTSKLASKADQLATKALEEYLS